MRALATVLPAVLPPVLTTVLAIAVLGACAPLRTGAGPPWQGVCEGALPANAAVSALLTAEHQGTTARYFLALHSAGPATQLQLLSLQGVPIYRLQCTNGRPQEINLARLNGSIAPRQMLAYLQALYADNSQQGGEPLRIHRQGSGPWFKRLTLEDAAAGNRFTVAIEEVAPLVSE
ncbi:hypothetical protein [Parahaliea mediterranea]|uniref:hypothetical protein n=1 Tax=Parahaliea mediterranea TaxID=651086 RepID=UPI001300A527|nr:hypothetical protein [Parahaliea mediterranea]